MFIISFEVQRMCCDMMVCQLLPHARVHGVKLSVCPSVVIAVGGGGTKSARPGLAGTLARYLLWFVSQIVP